MYIYTIGKISKNIEFEEHNSELDSIFSKSALFNQICYQLIRQTSSASLSQHFLRHLLRNYCQS